MKIWLYKFTSKSLEELQFGNELISVDAFITSLPTGVYTTLRTVGKTKIFQLDFHLSRLRESLHLMNVNIDFSLNEIRNPIKEVVTNFPSDEVRIRLFIPITNVEECYLILEPLNQAGSSSKINGVIVSTNTLSRVNPKAKLTGFIKKSEVLKQFCKEHDLEDSIMVNSKNELLEGLSSNFFAVIDDVLYTAADEVLNGATREIILKEAEKENVQIKYQPITYSNLIDIDEAFISSTSRGILPVIKIDDQLIGTGHPGKITKLLMKKLNIKLKEDAEEII